MYIDCHLVKFSMILIMIIYKIHLLIKFFFFDILELIFSLLNTSANNITLTKNKKDCFYFIQYVLCTIFSLAQLYTLLSKLFTCILIFVFQRNFHFKFQSLRQPASFPFFILFLNQKRAKNFKPIHSNIILISS